MNEYWKKIEEAIAVHSEMAEAEYKIWLDNYCDGDEHLKAEIESFISSAPAISNFLENNVGAYTAKIFVGEEIDFANKSFGHYKIIREIGHGGMGAVFLAERADGEFSQQVALKIVRQTLVDKEIEKQFKRERQILANLNHPNIAKLLDGGVSENDEPFIAMEYIEGETLIEYADKKDLDVQKQLDLFLKICQAVSFAHRNLVIHRDIKPSNILVTKDGEPKLLDFGLAKVLDDGLSNENQTQTAFRALTPAYASPEQLKGGTITTASDIYSLGIVLYELLTGERPFQFEGKSLDEIIRTITEFEPLLPSVNSKSKIRNSKLLKGDLDNIVLTALRKEPERRYQTVEQLATDIERHLKGLPVLARPNTYKYRVEKYIKRHKYRVLAASLILLSLIGGIIVSIWQARRAEMQRARAEKRFDEVRKLSNSLMFEIHDSVQNLQGSTPTRQLIVSRALEYLDSLAQESGDDSELQIELATAYQKIGDIQGNPYSANLGDTAGALKSYQKAISILANLKNSQTVESQISLGKSYRALGDIFEVEGKVDDCIDNYRRSLEIFENLAAQNPDQPGIADELARACETLGDGLSRMESGSAERLQNYQRNLTIRQSLAVQNPQNSKFQRSLGVAYLKVGGTMDAKLPEAAEYVRKCIVILEDLSKADAMNARARREVGFAYYQLGNVLTEAEKFTEALESRRRAFVIRQEFAANDPQNKQAQFDVATAYADLSEAFANIGDIAQALENAGKSQEIFEKLSKDDPENAIYRRNVGLSYEKSAFAYEQAAQIEKLSAAERRKNCQVASDWYQKTREVFAELEKLNQLQPRDAAQIDRLNQKITNCEKIIVELNLTHK